MFHGYTRGDVAFDDYTGIFRFESRSEPRWQWSRPDNYQYENLDVEWCLDQEGTGTLDLTTLTMTTEGRTFTLSEQALGDLLYGEDNWQQPPTKAEIKVLYELLIAAGQGTLPPPRHHGHSFEDSPIDGHLTHFSLGWRVPHILFAWPFIWLMIVAYVFFKRRQPVHE